MILLQQLQQPLSKLQQAPAKQLSLLSNVDTFTTPFLMVESHQRAWEGDE